MFGFTYDDKELFDRCKAEKELVVDVEDDGTEVKIPCGAYSDGEYDCTFDDKYIIYHVVFGAGSANGDPIGKGCMIRYMTLDKRTGYGSVVRNTTEIIPADSFESLTHDILFSIKYTGDRRYLRY